MTVLLAALLALAVLAGCTVPRPPGDAPLRYRDQVFTGVTVTRDIQYGSAPDNAGAPVALKLDLFRPTGDTQTKRPVVVWVHGGGFSSGDKASGPVVDLSNTFAKLGYVTASINYRLLRPEAPQAVAAIAAKHDAQAAVRWLRANAVQYRIDSDRIGIGGTSAGAGTANLVGVFSEDAGDSGNAGYSSKVGGFVTISGAVAGGLFAGAGDAPGLLFHGTADPTAPYQSSVDTAGALLRAGVPAFLQLLEGAGHVPYAQYRDLMITQSDYFFYTFLDLAHAQGQPAAAARAFEEQADGLAKNFPRVARQSGD